uniref:Putative cuticular protein n=1 Tax=Amblyomma triste TaxID=251400 RepID=A0A023G2W2_AMBTT
MLKAFLLLTLAVAALAQRERQSKVKADDPGPPAPYSFVYGSSAKDGTHGREETRDEHGTVRGSYRIALADGRMRVVKYVADKDGFRAGIATNEQGTESASSSGVVVHSEALSGPDAARAEAHKARARTTARATASRPAASASYNVERRVAPSHARMPEYFPAPGDYFEP